MVPGRKTDVRDSDWLAQLLALGLLGRSFVPPRRSARCATWSYRWAFEKGTRRLQLAVEGPR